MRPAPNRRQAGRWVTMGFVWAACACAQTDDPLPAPMDGQPVQVDPSPTFSVGVAEGVEGPILYDVARPFLRPDGSVAVPIRSTAEIQIFGSGGDLHRSLGGFGDGPGEFNRLAAAWARGDTIEAWDPPSSRITRFLPGGEVETISVRPGPPDLVRLTDFIGAPSTGWLLGAVVSWDIGSRDELAIFHLDAPDASRPTRVAETLGLRRERMGNTTGPAPLSPAARVALSNAGGHEELYVAETLTPEIRVYRLDGTLARAITWTPEHTLSPRDAFERVASVVTGGRTEPFRHRGGLRYPADWVRTAPAPETVPVFSGFLVDAEEFVWVRPFKPERDAAALGGSLGIQQPGIGGEWRIFSQDGDETGVVRLPDGLEPHQVTSHAVVGIYRDELGVESVRIYPLERH